MHACRGESEERDKVQACQRGVALHARASGSSVREDQKSSFSYSWKPKKGTADSICTIAAVPNATRGPNATSIQPTVSGPAIAAIDATASRALI